MIKTYVISYRVVSYIFEYMRVNYKYFSHIPEHVTYETACSRDIIDVSTVFRKQNEYDDVARVLDGIIKELASGKEAKYEFASCDTNSSKVETLVIPNKYITIYIDFNSLGLPKTGTENRVLIGKKL